MNAAVSIAKTSEGVQEPSVHMLCPYCGQKREIVYELKTGI